MAQQPSGQTPPSEGNNDGESQQIGPSSLEFITFTTFDQTIAPETKRKVRSHAMSRVQQSLRSDKPKGKKGEIALDISSLSQINGSPFQHSNISMSAAPLQPHTRGLGAGSSDPFTRYPIKMSLRTHELFDHLHGKTCPMFKTLNRIGFFKTVLDDAGFRQILSTSSAHMTVLREGTETAEAVSLSSQAVQSLNSRISDPTLCTSDGVMSTILAFACHSVMFNDLQGSLSHFNGLEEIVRRRGGLQAFASSPIVRTVIFWIDVNTAFLHDRVPRFHSKDDIVPRIQIQTFIPHANQPLSDACFTEEMTSAINDLFALNEFILSELRVRYLWDDGVLAGLQVIPLLRKLLSIRHDSIDVIFLRQESCRIAALLYLSGIRRRFGVALSAAVYIPKLKEALVAQDRAKSVPNESTLFWMTFVGAVQSLDYPEHEWFVSTIAHLILQKQWSSWEELIAAIRETLWIDGVLESKCHALRVDVAVVLWNSYGHRFQ